MQDRISLYPGRVKLIPVAGQANTYDMAMADQPSQEGTPLNKATLLADTVAQALGGVNTPSEAFEKLRSSVATAQSTANNAQTTANKIGIDTGYWYGSQAFSSDNKTWSKSFEVVPQFLLIISNNASPASSRPPILWLCANRGPMYHTGTEYGSTTTSGLYWSARKITWTTYGGNLPDISGNTYYYVAIGPYS